MGTHAATIALVISPEMTTLVGAGPPDDAAALPDAACALVFCGEGAAPDALYILPEVRSAWELPNRRLVLAVRREAVERLGGAALLDEPGGVHLPSALREVAVAILEPSAPSEALTVYRAAKSLELLCEALKRHAEGEFLPLSGEGALSPADTRRVIAARRLIDERSGEKLTLDAIARTCGLNRSKLTRGFRELYGRSVAEALAERRLERASRMLLTTDLPVSSVGYETGYLNNASFARAFGRRFGRTPSDYRARAATEALAA